MAPPQRERLRVLAVDDEPELLDVYTGYLRPEFSVTTTTSGREALELIDDSFDVVLLDRRMPGLSGGEVLAAIRDRGYETPVAMLTAVKPDLDIVDMPFDEYLEKPVDRAVMRDTIRVLANRSRFERESRQFFRLAGKQASLADRQLDQADRDEYQRLLRQFNELEETLDETLRDLLQRDQGVAADSIPDEEEITALLQDIHEHELPPTVEQLILEYQSLEDARPPFMWKWVHRLAPHNSLPCVPEDHRAKTAIDKTLVILYVTLMDDRLEKHGDRATFEALANLPNDDDPTVSDSNAAYVEFGRKLWKTIEQRISSAPQYQLYEELFDFDMGRAVDAIEYSHMIIRDPGLATMGDLERYESHNMVMFAYADIDLMHADEGQRDDLPELRDAIWTAQLMARIGNWVSTWERELREGDLSTGPIVYALEEDIVDIAEVKAAADDSDTADELIDRIRDYDVEKRFLSRWERHYHELRELERHIESVDLQEFITGTEEILRFHLASRGLK